MSRIFLPLGDETAIAAFWSGHQLILIADGSHQMDVSSLPSDNPFAKLAVSPIGDATRVTIDFDEVKPVYFEKKSGGWILGIGAGPHHASGLRTIGRDRALLFSMAHAARILRTQDLATGEALLVGLVTDETVSVEVPRHMIGFSLRRSVVGLVVAAESEQVELRTVPDGFLLDAVGAQVVPVGFSAPLGDASEKMADVQTILGLHDFPLNALRETYRRAWTGAALASPGERYPLRLAAVRQALALGDTRAARSIMDVAAHDYPRATLDRSSAFIRAAANMLDGNLHDAAFLDDPEAGNGPEVSLWRGLYLKRTGSDDAKAATLLSDGLALLKGYPTPLRNMMLPEIAEHVVRHGTPEQARQAADPGDVPASAGLLKGLLDQREGRPEQALQGFDSASRSTDPAVSTKGRFEAALQRFNSGQLDASKAADQFERLFLDARLAGIEPDVRLAAATAHAKAGEWSQAIGVLDESAALFPDLNDRIMQAEVQIVDAMLKSSDNGAHGTLSPLDEAALINAHLDNIVDPVRKKNVIKRLADQLCALDLWDGAIPLLQKLVEQASDPVERTAIDEQLASATLADDHPDQARTALDDLRSAGQMPTDEEGLDRLYVLQARTAAALGQDADALAFLAATTTQAGLELKAGLLEKAEAWPQATSTLKALVAMAVPATGALSDAQQTLVMRFAADAARAKDKETLAFLNAHFDGRVTSDAKKAVFQLLTADPLALASSTHQATP